DRPRPLRPLRSGRQGSRRASVRRRAAVLRTPRAPARSQAQGAGGRDPARLTTTEQDLPRGGDPIGSPPRAVSGAARRTLAVARPATGGAVGTRPAAARRGTRPPTPRA